LVPQKTQSLVMWVGIREASGLDRAFGET
jgi:hypothetical protein